MLGNALLTAFILLVTAWFIHFLIWKIRIPVAYPYWIIAIFFLTFLAYGIFYVFTSSAPVFIQFLWLLACLTPYGLIGCAYLMIYAGIIEYSPSVEILLEIKKHMPAGINTSELVVKTLPEEMLTDLRIQHLLDANMISYQNGMLSTTAKGQRYAKFIAGYRALLFIRYPGEG